MILRSSQISREALEYLKSFSVSSYRMSRRFHARSSRRLERTMPTYVPFDISRSVQGDNKVVSPRITITNNSSVPVSVDVTYTAVDLSKLPGTTWSDSGSVEGNQIAIGFQAETASEQLPTTLSGTRWLVANNAQNTTIASMGALESASVYVVGTLGNAVPENNSFTVTPTFVVRQA